MSHTVSKTFTGLWLTSIVVDPVALTCTVYYMVASTHVSGGVTTLTGSPTFNAQAAAQTTYTPGTDPVHATVQAAFTQESLIYGTDTQWTAIDDGSHTAVGGGSFTVSTF